MFKGIVIRLKLLTSWIRCYSAEEIAWFFGLSKFVSSYTCGLVEIGVVAMVSDYTVNLHAHYKLRRVKTYT